MKQEPSRLDNSFLERIKKAKDVRAVQKVQFATFASAISEEKKILAFEGADDRVIYHYWIRKLSPQLNFEAYQCNGKRKVLQLFDSLNDDLTGLKSRVCYFVDRDFDDLQGRPPHSQIYVTDRYSIESYIVCENVLDDLLNVDFHCNGHPELRHKIQLEFLRVYNLFLKSTKEVNFRIYLARVLKIKTGDLPESVHLMADIRLDDVTPTNTPLAELIFLEREPTPEEINLMEVEFNQLDPRQRYRGKFAFLFFIKWLGILRNDRTSASPSFFSGIPVPANSINGGFSLGTLAPRAKPPQHLGDFLAAI